MPDPHDPGPGPGDLYDVERLSARLGITTVTLKRSRHRQVPWLPMEAGWLNGGPVWTAASLAGIEERRPGLGRPARVRPAPPQ